MASVILSQFLRESHTFELYAAVLREWDCDAVYLPFETHAADEPRLAALFAAFRRSDGFHSIMVSDPFKQRVQPYLDGLTDGAARAGSVNVVAKAGGRAIGDNQDAEAFELGLRTVDGIDLAGRAVLFLGCGGVSSAVAARFATRLRAIGLIDTDDRKAGILRDALAAQGCDVRILPSAPGRDLRGYDTLYNGTGLGKGALAGRSPLRRPISPTPICFLDANYTPAATLFLEQGVGRGARAINGLSHMLGSAALHCSRITGAPVPVEAVAGIYRRLRT